MDLFAAEIGMDPAEVRRANLIQPDAFPFTGRDRHHLRRRATTSGALDLALEHAGYADLRAEQARRREAGDVVQLGIGVALYVEVTAGPTAGKEFAKVEIEADGSATVYTGSSPHGQGHHTAFAMLASDELGIPMDADPGRPRRHRPRRRGRGHHGLALAAARRLGRAQGVGRPGREGQADRRRRPRGQPRRRRARQGHRPLHVAGTPAIGRSWAELAEHRDRPRATRSR